MAKKKKMIGIHQKAEDYVYEEIKTLLSNKINKVKYLIENNLKD